MSRTVDLSVGAIAGAGALVAAVSSQVVDYNYPPDFTGIATIILAGGTALGALGIFITQMVGLSRQRVGLDKQKETHDLVNGMSTEKLREAREAAFAEGKLAGREEEAAARGRLLEAQMPRPIPKET